MFTTPEMRIIIERIDAINAEYGDTFFPMYSQEHGIELYQLHAAYQDAKTKAGL